MSEDVISFVRQRDYKYIRELGEGCAGKTVLLHDDILDLHFVCKKFAPLASHRDELFTRFMNEIKLMHRVLHPNIVRIFSYYAYPKSLSGYILMEYVEGEHIDRFLSLKPEHFDPIFQQTVVAFCYLEERNILHRDIRTQNILVSDDGIVKVIDLGFGKLIEKKADFNKSMSLEWQFSRPDEFFDEKYDFCTEVYFVGKLFLRILHNNNINSPHRATVTSMCSPEPASRIKTFRLVKAEIDKTTLTQNLPEFDEEDISIYRLFAGQCISSLLKVGIKSKYYAGGEAVRNLEGLFRNCSLEEEVRARKVLSCLISGEFIVKSRSNIDVDCLRAFIHLVRRSGPELQAVVFSNLFSRFDDLERFDEDEIPF